MKPFILTVTLILASGCGKDSSNQPQPKAPTQHGACYSPEINGNWRPVNYSIGANNNTLTLNEDCSGSTTYCNERFTYQPLSQGNSVKLTVSQANPSPECLPVGETTCNAVYDTQNRQIFLSCGGGKNLTNNYNKL